MFWEHLTVEGAKREGRKSTAYFYDEADAIQAQKALGGAAGDFRRISNKLPGKKHKGMPSEIQDVTGHKLRAVCTVILGSSMGGQAYGDLKMALWEAVEQKQCGPDGSLITIEAIVAVSLITSVHCRTVFECRKLTYDAVP